MVPATPLQGFIFLDFGVSILLLVYFSRKSSADGVLMPEWLPPVSDAVELPLLSCSLGPEFSCALLFKQSKRSLSAPVDSSLLT